MTTTAEGPPTRSGGPREANPGNRQSTSTDLTVPVRSDVLQAAAELVMDAGDRVDQAEQLGRAEGLRAGVAAGYSEGYRDGFDSGAEVAGAGVLLGLEDVVGREALDLLTARANARIPYAAGWRDRRALTADTDDPCSAECGRCSRCARAAAVATNLARSGQADFPGVGPVRMRTTVSETRYTGWLA